MLGACSCEVTVAVVTKGALGFALLSSSRPEGCAVVGAVGEQRPLTGRVGFLPLGAAVVGGAAEPGFLVLGAAVLAFGDKS